MPRGRSASRYQKKTPHEHILTRPDTYVGSVVMEETETWTCRGDRISWEAVNYVPALYKIIDEILVNASDNVVRCREEEDSEPCTEIQITVDLETGWITVRNNGTSPPVEKHEEEDVYVPEMIWAQLLTSENYDDTEQRKVGGTNGMGAKLTNIYSTEFIVHLYDASRHLEYRQVFSDNNTVRGEPEIKKGRAKKSWTEVSFHPDYTRFGMTGMDKSTYRLLHRRAHDLAIRQGVRVSWNGERLPVNNLSQYVDLFYPDAKVKKCLDVSDPEWQICVVYDPSHAIPCQQVSWVNGTSTTRGGTHVDYVTTQLIKCVRERIAKGAKGLDVKPAMIKDALTVFIECTVVNPRFDTQTKERLTTRVSEYGTSWSAPPRLLNSVCSSGILGHVKETARFKANQVAERGSKSKKAFRAPKLYEAQDEGKRDGSCTLILTEGDSASTFAISGLGQAGRRKYGVFPLRGKLLNVRDVPLSRADANKEIAAVTRIIGLEYGKSYTTTKGLRYGKVLILTDQDEDGSHIKGLIINYIHKFWPELAQMEGFIRYLPTPQIRAFPKRGRGEVLEFYSQEEYREWEREQGVGDRYRIEYYKGLGTNNKDQARECFDRLEDKVADYVWDAKAHRSTAYRPPKGADRCLDAITLAFGKGREDDRKLWLNTYDENQYVRGDTRRITYADFVHQELIRFSRYDTQRSIPCLADGLKPGQRKVLYGCFKRGLWKDPIKVLVLAGYVMEHVAYHHGDASLHDTIIRMAQTFVGSNNINLLFPAGQFGSRLGGGKDHASPRYISTRLQSIAETLFPASDRALMPAQFDDGQPIEPQYYLPTLPLVIINGVDGIGTGFSSTLESHNPADVIDNIRRHLAGKRMRRMVPWYRGFQGTVEPEGDERYLIRGVYTVKGDTLRITELPIRVWTTTYKEYLGNLQDQVKLSVEALKKDSTLIKGKGASRVAASNRIGEDIREVVDQSSETEVDFTIQFKKGTLSGYSAEQLEEALRLTRRVSQKNIHLWGADGIIRRYQDTREILADYIQLRLDLYEERRQYQIRERQGQYDICHWKYRFMKEVMKETIRVFRVPKAEVRAQLVDKGYPELAVTLDAKPSYAYLLSITVGNFGEEELAKLKAQMRDIRAAIRALEETDAPAMWSGELETLQTLVQV